MPEFIDSIWMNWKLRSRLKLLGFTHTEGGWSNGGHSSRFHIFEKNSVRIKLDTRTYATSIHYIEIDDHMPLERATSASLRRALEIIDTEFAKEKPYYYRYAVLPLLRTLLKFFGGLFGMFILVNGWLYVLDIIDGKNTITQDLFATSIVGLIGAFHCVAWTKRWAIRGALLLSWLGVVATFVVFCLL